MWYWTLRKCDLLYLLMWHKWSFWCEQESTQGTHELKLALVQLYMLVIKRFIHRLVITKSTDKIAGAAVSREMLLHFGLAQEAIPTSWAPKNSRKISIISKSNILKQTWLKLERSTSHNDKSNILVIKLLVFIALDERNRILWRNVKWMPSVSTV